MSRFPPDKCSVEEMDALAIKYRIPLDQAAKLSGPVSDEDRDRRKRQMDQLLSSMLFYTTYAISNATRIILCSNTPTEVLVKQEQMFQPQETLLELGCIRRDLTSMCRQRSKRVECPLQLLQLGEDPLLNRLRRSRAPLSTVPSDQYPKSASLRCPLDRQRQNSCQVPKSRNNHNVHQLNIYKASTQAGFFTITVRWSKYVRMTTMTKAKERSKEGRTMR